MVYVAPSYVVKKGPAHFFADKLEDVDATHEKELIHRIAMKIKSTMQSTTDDVSKDFEILIMLARGIDRAFSVPPSKSVSKRIRLCSLFLF